METTIMGYIEYTLGLYWDNGKETGSCYIFGLLFCGITRKPTLKPEAPLANPEPKA